MRVRLLQLLLSAAMVLVFVGAAWADEPAKEEKPQHTYVGVKKCKICHKKDGIYDSWAATKHATAWDSLSAEQQKDEALKPYYTTGSTPDGDLLTGIQCEACHGPGSDYKKKSIMEDREAAIAAGLIIPDATTCARCHNEKAPAKLAATAKDFDFAKMKEKGVHAKMVKAAEKAE
ncbi:MAG: hypothetical protein JSU65_01870 [Candidatus Zixiibacteriota bacterium]|nr:MAG: hypothetical protein JSU65_01870 [candidate division Zixibacteria bacterium]